VSDERLGKNKFDKENGFEMEDLPNIFQEILVDAFHHGMKFGMGAAVLELYT